MRRSESWVYHFGRIVRTFIHRKLKHQHGQDDEKFSMFRRLGLNRVKSFAIGWAGFARDCN